MLRRILHSRSSSDSTASALENARPAAEKIWRTKLLAALAILRQITWPDRSTAGVTERLHLRYCIIASAFFFLISSIFSVGYHTPDEYFQIVEFASAKLSISSTADLPWEYWEEMRSWLQPAIYVGVARAAELVGVGRPLTLLFLFRLVTAAVACSSLWMLVIVGRRWIAEDIDRRRLYSIAAFLWLLPFLGARTSSESLSATALCCGIAVMEWRTNFINREGRLGLAVLAGLAFALCFEFRFASGIMAAGAGLWYLLPANGRLSLFAGFALGALSALALGALADWWGYGHIAFPAYSYFYQNFVLGRSQYFGTAPFFAYLYVPLLESGAKAPLVFTLLGAALMAWLARPRNALTWASVPYFVILCTIGHKEARFLFPFIPFLPFFVIFALSSEPAVGARLYSFARWFVTGWRLKFAYALNFCGLLGVILLPQAANFPLYERMEKISFAADKPIEAVVIHAPGKMPYWDGEGRHLEFIEPKNLHWISNPSVTQLELDHLRGEVFFAFVNIPVQSPEAAAWIRARCAFVGSTFPRWLEPYDYFGWQQRSAWWMLYRCE